MQNKLKSYGGYLYIYDLIQGYYKNYSQKLGQIKIEYNYNFFCKVI